MKGTILPPLAYLCLIFASQTTDAIEVSRARFEDVLVAASGSSDSTFTTELADGWFARGPNAFDIDKDGNIYILDWLAQKVVKFDKQGNWLLTFSVPSDPSHPGTRSLWPMGHHPTAHRPRSDLAVDNRGNVYLTARDGSILKFSLEGTLLFRLPARPELRYLEVDRSGRFYNFPGWEDAGRVNLGMHGPAGAKEAELAHDFEYPDRLVVQKQAGDDLYFRVGGYLARATLEDYVATNKLDTVAILPNKLRLIQYEDGLVEHELPLPPPFVLLGFDTENRFYFWQAEHSYGDWMFRFCQTHVIEVWKLEGERLHVLGAITINFVKGEDPECSDRVLRDFGKNEQFIVSGDGTIYLLHGTVDTVKVSKTTFQPGSE